MSNPIYKGDTLLLSCAEAKWAHFFTSPNVSELDDVNFLRFYNKA